MTSTFPTFDTAGDISRSPLQHVHAATQHVMRGHRFNHNCGWHIKQSALVSHVMQSCRRRQQSHPRICSPPSATPACTGDTAVGTLATNSYIQECRQQD